MGWLGGHTFPKGICPRVNVIERMEFELAYNDSTVHDVNHYFTRTSHPNLFDKEYLDALKVQTHTISLSLSLSLSIYIYIYKKACA